MHWFSPYAICIRHKSHANESNKHGRQAIRSNQCTSLTLKINSFSVPLSDRIIYRLQSEHKMQGNSKYLRWSPLYTCCCIFVILSSTVIAGKFSSYLVVIVEQPLDKRQPKQRARLCEWVRDAEIAGDPNLISGHNFLEQSTGRQIIGIAFANRLRWSAPTTILRRLWEAMLSH